MKNSSPDADKGSTSNITSKEKSDIRTLMRFVEIYCRENHSQEKTPFTFKMVDVKSIRKKDLILCPECTTLLRYGMYRNGLYHKKKKVHIAATEERDDLKKCLGRDAQKKDNGK